VNVPSQRPSRRAATLLAAVLLLAACLAACSAGPATSAGSGLESTGGPSVQLSPNASTATGKPVSMRVVVPPAPGPVKPFRGEMIEQVYIAGGTISMFFQLNNVGEEPVTFLNTLYDYEPDQLYTPAVRLEWKEGGNATYTRAGRFFPSPAIVQPTNSAVYIMGGQPVSGRGTPANLVTHIKYCPTRGMNDVPGIPLNVGNLSWSSSQPGTVMVKGTLTQDEGGRRNKAPTIGIAFFDKADRFVGAVVAPSSGPTLLPGTTRDFDLTGDGVETGSIARAQAYAFIP
jgi:hypothetical protein